MKDTREIILKRALELFNEKGIEYGGLRELAKLLDIRVSNITYYFPTKDHLVAALAEELEKLNSAVIKKYNYHSLRDFLEMQQAIFYNQYQYRCLFISFVHLFVNNSIAAANYKQTEKKRRQRLEDIFNQLISDGYLEKKTSSERVKMLVSHIAFISRFWQSEATISHYEKTPDKIINHYFAMIGDILGERATAKGKKEISDFLKHHPGLVV